MTCVTHTEGMDLGFYSTADDSHFLRDRLLPLTHNVESDRPFDGGTVLMNHFQSIPEPQTSLGTPES
jgi:hypothetical protein